MSHTPERRYAVDLITFYEPASWGVTTEAELRRIGLDDARPVWDRILDQLGLAGLDGFEMTFPPADWTSALRAFGSAEGFRAELESRRLTMLSGFYSIDWSQSVEAIVEAAKPYLEFLQGVGCTVLVAGPPFRSTLGSQPPAFADFDSAKHVADTMNRLGHLAMGHGVRVALHTEAQTTFYLPRDIELHMMLTDPDYVWFCPDAAHLTLGGSSAAEIAERFRDRILISHWKDATGAMPRDIPIDDQVFIEHGKYMATTGSGVVDWARWSAVMATTPTSDWVLIELDMVPDPVTEVRRATRFVQDLLRSGAPGVAVEP